MKESITYETAKKKLYLYPMDERDRDGKGNLLLPDMLKKYVSAYKKYIFFFLIYEGELVTHETMHAWKEEGITPDDAFYEASRNTTHAVNFLSIEEYDCHAGTAAGNFFLKIGFNDNAPDYLFGAALAVSEEFQEEIMDEIGSYYLFFHDLDSFYVSPKALMDASEEDPMTCFDCLIADTVPGSERAAGGVPHLVNRVFVCGRDGNSEYSPKEEDAEDDDFPECDEDDYPELAEALRKNRKKRKAEGFRIMNLYFACLFLYQTHVPSGNIADELHLPEEELLEMETRIRGKHPEADGG